jgi:hypothetical protein
MNRYNSLNSQSFESEAFIVEKSKYVKTSLSSGKISLPQYKNIVFFACLRPSSQSVPRSGATILILCVSPFFLITHSSSLYSSTWMFFSIYSEAKRLSGIYVICSSVSPYLSIFFQRGG